MKNVDEALKQYRKGLFKAASVEAPEASSGSEATIPQCSEQEWLELVAKYDFPSAEPRRRRRGRPWTLDMNVSFHAFLFVYRHMEAFKKLHGKKLHGLKRCPETVRDALIEDALATWYKGAVKERVQEFLREKKKYLGILI